jgi:hypothetical protein
VISSLYVASSLQAGSRQIAVYLNGPAPVGGMAVKLASSNGAVVTVPLTVTVVQGTSRMTVPITVKKVMASTMVTISATLGSTVSGRTTVIP